jgi:hypothetical protein
VIARIGPPPLGIEMRSWLGLALWLAIGFGLTGLVALALEKSHTVPQQQHDLRDVRSAAAPP